LIFIYLEGGKGMKKNMGTADRIIRAIIGVAIIVLYFAGQITGVAAIILGILTVILLATSITGVCPGYWPFGISTIKKA
jgi:Na+/H+ antiporter NhaB